MQLSFGFIVKALCFAYAIYGLWRFLFVRKAYGFWDFVFDAMLNNMSGVKNSNDGGAGAGKGVKDIKRVKHAGQMNEVDAPDTGEVNIMGPSKTVYIPAPPKPESKPLSAAPKPRTPSRPASDTVPEQEPKVVESVPLETVRVEQGAEPEPDPDDIEVETSGTDCHEFVDDDDLPAPMDDLDGSSTGLTIEELDNASQVIHGVRTDEPAAVKAAGTLYEVGQSGLVEFEGDQRMMQQRVVSLLERFGYPSDAYSKWSDEEFSATVFG